jgi:poly-gamma-glutamate synthesis protein (capsule biosynthesis protein)
MRLVLAILVSAALAGCAGSQYGSVVPEKCTGCDGNSGAKIVQAAARGPTEPFPKCPIPTKASPMVSFSRGIDPARMLTLAAVGDVIMHDRLQKYAAGHKDGFYSMMQPVADIIQAADVSFANLEGPAAPGVTAAGRKIKEPKGRYDGKIYAGYPSFNYHPSIATDLKRAGFDVVLTANNHALDRRSAGADGTVKTLTAAGLPFTGSRAKGEKDRAWHTITPVASKAGNYNIAWLGCTYGTNDVPDPHKQVLNCFADRAQVLEEIAALRTRKDVHGVIFAPHWGTEYRHKPNKKQKALAYDALDAGALAVIGTHSHVVSPWEKYVTKDGRETFITYSLGNFVSNQEGLERRASIILLLGLMPDLTGEELIVAVAGWVPLHMYRADGKGIKGPIYARAIDRTEGHPKAMEILLKHLPAANIHPPTTDFWAGRACRPPAPGV